MNGFPHVDIVVLHRPGQPVRAEVKQAALAQRGIAVVYHEHAGEVRPEDENRWYTIARARNAMKRMGTSPYVMFVDDDVVLQTDCVQTLLQALASDTGLAAVAADYLADRGRSDRLGHVGMGATLFRRSVVASLHFRATPRWCECWCAAFDLNAAGQRIAYIPTAKATHLRKPKDPEHSPVILAAFDRRDIKRFEHYFLKTLRGHGNRETVVAVGYGLYPSELKQLSGLRGLQVIGRPNNGQMVPVRRLHDFALITERLAPNHLVAYWDVADVLFQGLLEPLWAVARQNPNRLLAVAEPKGYPNNAVIRPWSLSIHDPIWRQRAFELLKRNRFLNSGFAAGSARTMHHYFASAHRMLQGPELHGTTDWGDQMALNVYCHSEPNRWLQVDPQWNYCVHDRAHGEVYIEGGVVKAISGTALTVVHGNARSLRQFGLAIY